LKNENDGLALLGYVKKMGTDKKAYRALEEI
jgi:hypothetical protein